MGLTAALPGVNQPLSSAAPGLIGDVARRLLRRVVSGFISVRRQGPEADAQDWCGPERH